MERAWLFSLAFLCAMAVGVNAQDASFDGLMSDLPRPAAPAVSALVPAAGSVSAAAGREWLVLVFLNGVNDLGLMGLANADINEMEQVGSTDRMAVVVEYGILGADASELRDLRFQRVSRTIYVSKDADPDKITSRPFYASNDSDMGSAASLVRFVKRGIRKFPAKKTALIVWNHGAGRLGISFDDVSGNHMEVDQLGLALAQIKQALGRKLDVFATDACYMQMAGVAYELKDSAAVLVGSEEEIPLYGYPYNVFLGSLAANPGLGPEGLGRLLVDAYGASYKGDATLSALRTSALPGFVRDLNNWVEAVMADPEAFKVAASTGLAAAVSRFSLEGSKDLYDYVVRVYARLPEGSRAKNTGKTLLAAIASRLIIRNAAKPASERAYTRARGLAIYLPELRYNSANYERLAFARDSLWDEFLRGLMEERLKP